MNDIQKTTAQRCLEGAYSGGMGFPEIVGELMGCGFESYHVDYLRGTATYYVAGGGNVELALPESAAQVAAEFAAEGVQAAIKEAQQQAPGYSYKGFCQKVMAAGCAGYFVSFAGRRALYFGRTAQTHVEHFPQ